MPDATFNPDAWLAGTPYLVPNDEAGRERFSKALWESYEAKKDVIAVRRSVEERADALLAPLNDRLRAQQVAESNAIEGYDWTEKTVSAKVKQHQELLALPIRQFVAAVRDDPRAFQALGLYRATDLAETWTRTNSRP